VSPPKIPLVYPRWEFKNGPPLEDVFLYRIRFTKKGNKVAGTWYVHRKNSRGYYPPSSTRRLKVGARLKGVRPGKDFFYVSMERLTSRSLEIRSLTKEMCGGAPVEITKDKKQTVELPLEPFKRFPLGEKRAKPIRRTRWHKFYIPTKYGGYLNIGLSRGRAKLFFQDYQSRLEKESGKKYRSFSGRRWFKIPENKHGWYFLKIEGVHRYRLTIRFIEEGFARKKDGSPHIPWNFYWFPVNKDVSFSGGGVFWDYSEAMRSEGPPEEADAKKYLKDLKKKLAAARAKHARTGSTDDWGEAWILEEKVKYPAATWEQEFHYKKNQPDWAGHCHNSAPASVLLEMPQKGVLNGKRFSAEQVGLLATEWTGNFKSYKREGGKFMAFTLGAGGKLLCPLVWTAYPILHFFKPSDPVSRAHFIKSVENQFDIPALRKRVRNLEASANTQPKKNEAASARSQLQSKEKHIKDSVDEAIRDHGGTESGFQDHVMKKFGQAAAGLHKFLQERVLRDGLCLVGNLRAGSSKSDCSPVWNHPVFKYRSEFKEEPFKDDEKCIAVNTRLVASADAERVVGTMPARAFDSVFGGQRVREMRKSRPGKSSPPEIRLLTYDVQFNAQGEIDVNHANNRWTKVANKKKRPLFAPTTLLVYDKPLSKRRSGTPFGLGNPFVDWRVIKKNLSKVVDKFR
jgi:hypothetical protein